MPMFAMTVRSYKKEGVISETELIMILCVPCTDGIVPYFYLCFTDTDDQEVLIRKLWGLLRAEPHSDCLDFAIRNMQQAQPLMDSLMESWVKSDSFYDLVKCRLQSVLQEHFTKEDIITLSLSRLEACLHEYNDEHATPEPSPTNNERPSPPTSPTSLTFSQSTLVDGW